MSCEECKKAYKADNVRLPFEKDKKRKVRKPPCKTCKPKPLLPENYIIMEIFNRCGDEWIRVGYSGEIIALPSPSIESVMNIIGIGQEDKLKIFDKVKMVSRIVSRELAIEREKKIAELEERNKI